MTFSAADAAFEGFRVTRRHPAAVLAWAAVMLAANIASGLAVGVIAGPSWIQFETLAASQTPDAAAMGELLPRVFPAALLSGLIQVVAAGAVNASVLRALLRPERSATLELGRDEVRVIGLLLMFFLASFAATIALSIVLSLLGLAIGPAAATLAPVASLAASVVLAIRFSLAGPMTIAEHRFQFRPSWAATRPWFWRLLGSELLAAMLGLVVVVLAHMVFVPIAAALAIASGHGLGDLAGLLSPDFSTPARLMRPAPLAYVAFVSVLYALVLVILVGPPVELYRRLRPAPASPD